MNQNQQQINQASLLAGVVGQVGCLTVILIGVALGAGIFLDYFLESRPIFTILFMVGSVPITLYLIVRVSLTAVARAQKIVPAENLEEEKKKKKKDISLAYV